MKITSIMLLAVLIGACSSSQKTPEFEDYLATNIRSDGSKEFYYTVAMTNTGNSKRGGGRQNVSGGARVKGGSSSNTHGSAGITVGGSHGGKGSRGGSRSGSRPDEKISEQLEKKLLATGFCRDGWMETERHIQPPNASIRGECNETATDKDYKNFPNTEDNLG